MACGTHDDFADTMTGKPIIRVGRTDASGELLAGFFGAVAVSATRFVDLLLTWQARARERQHLRMMEGYQLRDLGLTRADVVSETGKPFWRR